MLTEFVIENDKRSIPKEEQMAPKEKKPRKAKRSSQAKKRAKKPMLKKVLKGAAGELAPQEAQDIVVNNTPHPEKFSGPDQQLARLGVTEQQVPGHKRGIKADVEAKGMTIDEAEIVSGPGVDVATCRDSVLDNAK